MNFLQIMCVYLKKVLPLQHYTMNRYSFLNSLSHFLVASFILFSMERVTFYIDGFNFYYGIKTEKDISPEWGKSYWIDLVKLCSQFFRFRPSIGKGDIFHSFSFEPGCEPKTKCVFERKQNSKSRKI